MGMSFKIYLECLRSAKIQKRRKLPCHVLEGRQISSERHKWLCIREQWRCACLPALAQTCCPWYLLFGWVDQHLSEKVSLAPGRVLSIIWLWETG